MTNREAAELVRSARERGRKALSEHESKQLLAAYGIPVTREVLARDGAEAASVAETVGYPVALKACSAELLHKSEQDAVLLHLGDSEAVRRGAARILASSPVALDGVLVQEMVPGNRELVLGLSRDPQFGPCVMLGLGGVLTEILEDTAFRVAPFDETEAEDMTRELRSSALLGPFRGQEPVDREALCRALVAMGRIGLELEPVAEVDVNPIIVTPRGRIVAADALVVLKKE
jgi:succinyl-CoA synthetase beta subunit